MSEGNGRGEALSGQGPIKLMFATPTRQYFFDEPQPDITISEVIQVMDLKLFAILMVCGKAPPQVPDVVYEVMSDGAKRHVRVVNQSPILVPTAGMNGRLLGGD